MKTTTIISIACFAAACSSAPVEPTARSQPVSEPSAAAPADDHSLASVEFHHVDDDDAPLVEVTGATPFLLNGELMPAGARKLMPVPRSTAFEVLIDGMEVHLPGDTLTLTMTRGGWEVEGSIFYAYPPDRCDTGPDGGVTAPDTSNLEVNFGISCGPRPDIGKFAVSSCGQAVETFHRGTFSGGPLFALTQYERTELFLVPPGASWTVGYDEDRRGFAVW